MTSSCFNISWQWDLFINQHSKNTVYSEVLFSENWAANKTLSRASTALFVKRGIWDILQQYALRVMLTDLPGTYGILERWRVAEGGKMFWKFLEPGFLKRWSDELAKSLVKPWSSSPSRGNATVWCLDSVTRMILPYIFCPFRWLIALVVMKKQKSVVWVLSIIKLIPNATKFLNIRHFNTK